MNEARRDTGNRGEPADRRNDRKQTADRTRTALRDFDVASLAPREIYEFMTRTVCPRPIAFVSSMSASGVLNLAPFSYFTAGGLNPPSIVFCAVSNRRGEIKDTLFNIRETGEYVINIVTRDIAEPMNQTSANYPWEVSEFDETGFTPEPSLRVKPPRVAESPISIECRTHSIVSTGSGPLAGYFVIGEILTIRARESILDENGYPDSSLVGFLGRLGGDEYTHVREDSLFELERPPSQKKNPSSG